jgi:thiol-disulfide isomerase/thioredoxin
MKISSSMLARLLPALILAAACSQPPTTAEETKTGATAPGPADGKLVRVAAASFGEAFPPAVFKDLNPASGTGGKVDLAASVGKRPVVLFYWMGGRPRSEKMLQDLERIVGEMGPGKVDAYGIVRGRPGMEVPKIVERIGALGVKLPVLEDPDFRLGQQLAVRAVPALAILDAEGKLRLANGGSLKQALEYNMDVEAAVRRVAAKGKLGTYGYLPRYEPVNELVGKPSPDFEAPLIGSSDVKRWSSLIDPKRLNVLVFWSVDCPHCKKSLPAINYWVRQHPDGINLVTAATIADDLARTKTAEYCRLNQFVFPTLADKQFQIGELFQVTSTPTILIVRPDGVVDSVLLGESDFAKAFEERKKVLLKG